MINMRSKTKIVRRRERAAIRCRLQAGFFGLLRNPWKIGAFVCLTALFCALWGQRDKLLTLVVAQEAPLLICLYEYAIAVLMVLLFALLLMKMLIAFGTPRSAAGIECSLVHIGLTDRYGYGPLLVGKRKIKGTEIRRLTFFSRGISKEIWERQQQAIEDVLNVRWVESPSYGGKHGDNRNYIVLKVAPGAGTPPKEVLYDDEL